MVLTGLFLAVITGVGFWFIFRKLPRWARRFLRKHVLFTDATACILTYLLFGGTLTALFAAAWMGVMVSIILAITNHPTLASLAEDFSDTVSTKSEEAIEWIAQTMAEKNAGLKDLPGKHGKVILK
jgi:Ca2+/Na+ antiporter